MNTKAWLHDYNQGRAMGISCKDCDDAAEIIKELDHNKEMLWEKAIDAAYQQALKYADRHTCGSKEWDAAYYIAQNINALKMPEFREGLGIVI